MWANPSHEYGQAYSNTRFTELWVLLEPYKIYKIVVAILYNIYTNLREEWIRIEWGREPDVRDGGAVDGEAGGGQ